MKVGRFFYDCIMKNLLAIFTLMLGAVCFGQEKEAFSADFQNLASDMCSCVEQSASVLSPQMRTLFIDYHDNSELLKEKMTEYILENMEQAIKEMELLDQIAAAVDSCKIGFENKYKNLYANYSEEEIDQQIIQLLRNNYECKLTYAFYMMANSSAKDGAVDDGE